MRIRNQLVSRAAELRPLLLDIYKWLWAAFLALYAARIFGIGIPTDFNFWWLGLTLGLLGAFVIQDETESPSSASIWWLIAALGFALLIRVIPYMNNSVPLGYDPGLYKRVFENPLPSNPTIYPLPFSLLMGGITALFGFEFAAIQVFIVVSVLAVVALWAVAGKAFGPSYSGYAAFLAALSFTQFDVFLLNYYKNVFGIMFLLFAFLLFERSRRLDWLFVLSGVLVAGMHQLALAVFGLAYGMYWLVNVRRSSRSENLAMIGNGVLVLVFTLVTNFDRIDSYLVGQAVRFANTVGEVARGGTQNAGLYLDTALYFNLNAAYLALAIPGIRRLRQFQPFWVSTLVLGVLIVLKVFFYRRFLIYFDIFLILAAALGLARILGSRALSQTGTPQRIAVTVLIGLLALASLQRSAAARPWVNEAEIQEIEAIAQSLPPASTLVTLDSYYAPWFEGWTDFQVEAPGMWGDDHTYSEWEAFWAGDDTVRVPFLYVYPRPLYLVVGRVGPELAPFNSPCFEPILLEHFTLYRVRCP